MNAINFLARYALALSLISLFLTLAFGVSFYEQRKTLKSGEIINIAGRQRMLSQRISLFAMSHFSEPSLANEQEVRALLELFVQSHKDLLIGNDKKKVSDIAGRVASDIFFGEEHGLDKEVKRFQTLILSFLGAKGRDREDILNEAIELSTTTLLSNLDRVVTRIENYDKMQNKKLRHYELAFYLLAIVLLFLEGVFIFLPSYKRIKLALEEKKLLDIAYKELKEKSKNLIDTRAHLEAVIEGSIDGIFITDLNGFMLSYNKAAKDLYGYRQDEVIGMHVKDFIAPGFRHDYFQGFERKLGQLRQSKAISKAGDTFDIEFAVNRISAADSDFYSGIVRNVTKRKETEDGLLKANAELEEFAYRTSHDLRSPIVSSLALSKIIINAINDKDYKKATLSAGMIEGALQRLETLIVDILNLTQTKYDEHIFDDICLQELIVSSVEKMQHLEGFKRLDIQNKVAPDLTVRLDKSRLTLIIENIVSNAIKYQDKSKNSSVLSIQASVIDKNLHLAFEDNGLGVPPEEQGKMFQMFKRFHPKSSFGSGLGLYMVKKSCEAMGGELGFESAEAGTKFEFSIPLQK